MPGRELRVAVKAAKAAGKIILQGLGKRHKTASKAFYADIVTETDKKAEKAVISIIRKAFPNHSILAEESGLNETGSEFSWVIDPIDGTNNFFHSYPFFCTSIAFCKNNEPLAGAIFDPVKKEMFYAEKGKGAFLNGKRIHVSRISEIKRMLCVTGFHFKGKNSFHLALKNFEKIYLSTAGVRRDGSAALDLAYVASGRMDFFWEFNLKPWDIAAGKLLVEEAGGIVSNNSGKNYNFWDKLIVASNGKKHSRLLKMLKVK